MKAKIKQVRRIASMVEAYSTEMECLSDEQLKRKTTEFKNRLRSGELLDSLLPEAYAVVREASRRTVGLYQFPVQILSGIFLHRGFVSEQATGEGKTLVAAMPAYLNALSGKGVHVVTVNDYLAKRDAENIGRIYSFLGLSVGCVLKEMSDIQRKEEYAKDITYVTNTELGFDYLRDNMVSNKYKRVQRGFEYCIIDEVDSVLIDEARTPLIISGGKSKSSKLYLACDELAKKMEKGEASGEFTKMSSLLGEDITETGDFIVIEKEKIIELTENGVKKVESYFGIENLSAPQNCELSHNIHLALRAHYLMKKDRDYVVKNGEVMIVDEFTGRTMPGRMYSDGLHQAIEAKEKVIINAETETHATVTYQNFFNKYRKKCGMTGTAYTERKEFHDIYRMNVVRIPTNKPVIRCDEEDALYITKKEKFRAVINAVKEAHSKRQPVLIGTATIKDTELLDALLNKENIPHSVLNAKFLEKEAEIISHAGEAGAVTIATNMAGRGTDIKLDQESREAGGLLVIGTQRHESRRIDNQLRGRSGRQGDPGRSKFYLSLEDDLMRLFGSTKLSSAFRKIGIKEDEEIKHRMVSKFIRKAQKKVEFNNFSARKNVFDFDRVNNKQREVIYGDRNSIIDEDDLFVIEVFRYMLRCVIEEKIFEKVKGKIVTKEEFEKILFDFKNILKGMKLNIEFKDHMTPSELFRTAYMKAEFAYEESINNYLNKEILFQSIRRLIIEKIDLEWMKHLGNLEMLRQNISLVGYGQIDPVNVYQQDAFTLFQRMIKQIHYETVKEYFTKIAVFYSY